MSSSVSALRAFGKKMAVTSNNVANANTDEFKKSRAILKEGVNGKVEVEIDKVATPGPIATEVKEGGVLERELSNVEFEEEIVQSIIAQRGYGANLVTVKTYDEMLGTLIDMKS